MNEDLFQKPKDPSHVQVFIVEEVKSMKRTFPGIK